VPDSGSQGWFTANAAIDFRPGTRLQVSEELQIGDGFREWTTGAMLSYRMKRIVDLRHDDIDDEKEHYVVLATGYEYLRTNQNGKIKNEHRVPIQGTGRHNPGLGFLLTDRNRVELRWVNGDFDLRYRNKLVIERPLKAEGIRFTPYASGELFYDRNHDSWNENHFSFGVQVPYKKLLMLDTYYLHKNCTTCNPNHVDAFGVTLNIYFKLRQ
jgi:hypothetical protein